MSRLDYWIECLSESFEHEGIAATDEQISAVAKAVEIAAENMSMAFPSGPPDAPRESEEDRLRRELAREKAKKKCLRCNGTGDDLGIMCSLCNGQGRH